MYTSLYTIQYTVYAIYYTVYNFCVQYHYSSVTIYKYLLGLNHKSAGVNKTHVK